MKIGNIKLNNPFILAPLDGVNCAAFRLLCKENGASLVYSQMLHVDGVSKLKDTFADKYLDVIKEERPISIQLVGAEPKNFSIAAEILEDKADAIDVNLGCSVQKMISLKAGAYLLKYPAKIEKIVTAAVKGTNKPITAKIRLGWDDKHLNFLKVAKLLEDNGISALAVHGRTAVQGFSGKADWSPIKEIKEKLNIPVIGNGDIFKPEEAKSMLDETKCDAVMIGRAAIGNPFIFRQCSDFFNNGRYETVNCRIIKESFLKFLEHYERYQNKINFTEVKQHSVWFMKGINGSAEARNKLSKCKRIEEIKNIYCSLFQ